MTSDTAPSDSAEAVPFSWREHAVSRRLDPARARAEVRAQRFVDAALDLMVAGRSGNDLTVQEVVEKSGQSLRSFYQSFGGKHELLLAMLEESVRYAADNLREQAAQEDGPLERLHVFVIEYYRTCRPTVRRKAAKARPTARTRLTLGIADFAQELLSAHPEAAARAFEPIVALFEELLAEAVAYGDLPSDLHIRRVAGVVLQSVMFNGFSSAIVGASGARETRDQAEELWDLFMRGLAA